MAQLSIIIFLLCGIGATFSASLIGGEKCGERNCGIFEFCSEVTFSCVACANICNQNHNFDEHQCKEKCQDYLFESRFGNLKGNVENLSRLVTVTLTLVILMIIVLACLFSFQCYRWKIKKNITLATIKNKFFKRKSDPNEMKSPPVPVKDNNKRPELRLEVGPGSPETQSGHSPVTVSTIISRKPAEDSTLDYAYDNHAMSDTPSPR